MKLRKAKDSGVIAALIKYTGVSCSFYVEKPPIANYFKTPNHLLTPNMRVPLEILCLPQFCTIYFCNNFHVIFFGTLAFSHSYLKYFMKLNVSFYISTTAGCAWLMVQCIIFLMLTTQNFAHLLAVNMFAMKNKR